MDDCVLLSKIAVWQEIYIEENLPIAVSQDYFEYNEKSWHLLETFANDAEKLMEIIETNQKIVSFVESDDGKFLMAKSYNKKRKMAEATVDSLLEIIYPNFSSCKDTQNDEDSPEGKRMLKAYVTTKLFDALQKQHSLVVNARMQNATLTLPSIFLPTLRKYQEKCVLWLLAREKVTESMPAFFVKLVSKDGETVVHKHLYSRYMQNEAPSNVILSPGGILADEMGLGKTVEMLALILLNVRMDASNAPSIDFECQDIPNKRLRLDKEIFCLCTSKSKNNLVQCKICSLWQHLKCVQSYTDEEYDSYFCPSCWQHVINEGGLIKSQATLIVSPNTIKLQWLSEIKRHIQPTPRVFLYDGVHNGKWVSPDILSRYDIVLTDYNALRTEIYFSGANESERATRNKPRTIRLHSPLLMMEWWRVCLDEAQMVESNTSKIAALVRMIPAINRWAVTGTPIQRSLDDLQSLLEFIGFDAITEARTWNYLVNEFLLKYSMQEDNLELIKLLQKCMWRTSKAHIMDELQIPPQREEVHYIQFDNFENLFYNEQHNDCQRKFTENVNKYTSRTSSSSMTPKIMKIILQPFLKIRQTCTMPVVISSSRKNNACVASHKKFLQPKDLHDYLKSTNELTCKSELRTMASCHNGLAGVYFLQQKYKQALAHYETVLKMAEQYTDINITLDSLLQIHALHNLMELKKCQIMTQEAHNIERLETYQWQYNSLEWKYLKTYSTTLRNEMTSYSVGMEKLKNTRIGVNLITFMADALICMDGSDFNALLNKIYEECTPRFPNANMKLIEIHSVRTLLIVMEPWWTKVEIALKKTINGMKSLKYFTENVKPRHHVSPDTWKDVQELVNSVYDCHLSELLENKKTKNAIKKKKKGTCKLCLMRNDINTFECLLFDKVLVQSSNITEGKENPSFEMFLCKLSLSFIKNKLPLAISREVLEKCCLYMDSLQIVCKKLIQLWIEIEYTIKAYDELNMCKMRITLKQDGDEKSTYKIEPHEIKPYLINYQNELLAAQSEFVNKLARLKYINHLTKKTDLGTCPICRTVEQDQSAVLECGHHLCFRCLQSLRQYAKGSIFKCSVCRNDQRYEDLFYVKRNKEDYQVKGNFSSKITFLVNLIFKLQKEQLEGDLKILIFSEWIQILNTIGLALDKNNITFRIQCTPKTLNAYKDPLLGITCLLMPFVQGSKGLNLIEANHVFLVEPILNPGEELQAIGRVHRFGQTRTTTIHRFIMRDSIEENIFNFISSSSKQSEESENAVGVKWDFENVSLDDFSKLFKKSI